MQYASYIVIMEYIIYSVVLFVKMCGFQSYIGGSEDPELIIDVNILEKCRKQINKVHLEKIRENFDIFS